MLVTCDTSHFPIGPCSLVGRLPSEEILQQSSTARWSSSCDCAENAGNGVRSAFFCAAMFWLFGDMIVVPVLILVVCKALSILHMFLYRRTSYQQACAATLYKILNIIRRKTKHVNQKKDTHRNNDIQVKRIILFNNTQHWLDTNRPTYRVYHLEDPEP